jgi:hypothetical protein
LIGVYALIFITACFNRTGSDNVFTTGQFSGIEAATVIFVFISGLCSFKEAFLMLMQNGISRRTFFLGRIITVLSVALTMALIDQIIIIASKAVSGLTDNIIESRSLFEQLYHTKASGMSFAGSTLSSFVFAFSLYLCFMSAGYLITLIFYRLNKAGKLVIGIGVPVGLFTVLPIFDLIAAGGRISAAIYHFIAFAFGLETHQLANALITCIVAFFLLSGLSWLLVRRAPVRV